VTRERTLTPRRLLRVDWDAIAGIIAAVAALILHLLHVISVDVLVTIAVVLMALLFIRNLRREHIIDQIRDDLHATASGVHALRSAIRPQDTVLVGPASIAAESTRFSESARGEMVWFHVCLTMFRPQALFDVLLKPALDNPAVESILFILDPSQQGLWAAHTAPKILVHPAAAQVPSGSPSTSPSPSSSQIPPPLRARPRC
jgi:hypothetical protein